MNNTRKTKTSTSQIKAVSYALGTLRDDEEIFARASDEKGAYCDLLHVPVSLYFRKDWVEIWGVKFMEIKVREALDHLVVDLARGHVR